jgi:hypothetical protein
MARELAPPTRAVGRQIDPAHPIQSDGKRQQADDEYYRLSICRVKVANTGCQTPLRQRIDAAAMPLAAVPPSIAAKTSRDAPRGRPALLQKLRLRIAYRTFMQASTDGCLGSFQVLLSQAGNCAAPADRTKRSEYESSVSSDEVRDTIGFHADSGTRQVRKDEPVLSAHVRQFSARGFETLRGLPGTIVGAEVKSTNGT